MKVVSSCCFIIPMLLLSACSRVSSDVRFALKHAGENRAQLQTVLEHYRDSLAEYVFHNSGMLKE